MFGFKKKKKADSGDINQGLAKTRKSFLSGLADLFRGKNNFDEDMAEELETRLLSADVGIEATDKIMSALREQLRNKKSDFATVLSILKQQLSAMLLSVEDKLTNDDDKLKVILVVGVNGVGKTTTIGKLANYFKQHRQSVMLAAGDTFRAAAVEQLQSWGQQNDVPVIAQQTGSDSASVIFDAIASAKTKNIDVLIADTAGRLHTKSNLMEELKKIERVMQKHDAAYPTETILVLDAGTGQNALSQVNEFQQAVKIDSIILTKMDGTAKGGILFAIADKYKMPVRFIGIGEKFGDLKEFDSLAFIDAVIGSATQA